MVSQEEKLVPADNESAPPKILAWSRSSSFLTVRGVVIDPVEFLLDGAAHRGCNSGDGNFLA
jgi:hypothetical protein